MEPAKIHSHDDIGCDTAGAGASATDDDDDVVDVIVVAFQVGVWLIILAFLSLGNTSKQDINCIMRNFENLKISIFASRTFNWDLMPHRTLIKSRTSEMISESIII